MGSEKECKLNLHEMALLIRFIEGSYTSVSKESDEYRKQKDIIISLVEKGCLQAVSATSGAEYRVTDYGNKEYKKCRDEIRNAIILPMKTWGGIERIINSSQQSAASISSNLMKKLRPQINRINKIVDRYENLNQLYAQQIYNSLAPVRDAVAKSVRNIAFDADAYQELIQNIELSAINISKYLRLQLRGWDEAIFSMGFDKSMTLMATEGIPIIGACSPKISSQLVKATSWSEREELIIQFDTQILSFCEAIAQESGGSDEKFLSKSIEMYRQGEYVSAQAIAAIAIDPLLHRHAELLVESNPEVFESRIIAKRYILGKQNRRSPGKDFYSQSIQECFEDRSLTTALIFALFMSTHKQYRFDKSAVPTVFNRHAIVHSGDINHFTRVNALKGIMSVSCALWGFYKPHSSQVEENMV